MKISNEIVIYRKSNEKLKQKQQFDEKKKTALIIIIYIHQNILN